MACLAVFATPTAFATVFTVNSAADPGDGVCDAINCTLREAITAANGAAGTDQIVFDLPLGGTTIAASAGLPSLTTPITIDGTSQPSYPGEKVVVDGSGAGAGVNGLVVSGSGSVITGIVVNGFSNRNVWLTGSGNTLGKSLIGTNAAGTTAVGTPAFASVGVGGSGNTVGGPAAADGNVIAGGLSIFLAGASGTIVRNNAIGVDVTRTVALGTATLGIDQAPTTTVYDNVVASISVQSASGTDIRRNLIGTNGSGTAALSGAPSASGIFLLGASNTTIGEAGGDGNVISGKSGDGIRIQDSTGVVVRGNRIGTSLDGQTAIPNTGDGILTTGSTTPPGVTIGGTAAGAGNTIAHNAGAGVAVFTSSPTGIVLRANAIFANGGLPIDLASDGPTANDAGDADTGPNGLQNKPVVVSASQSGTGGGLLTVGISLSSKVGTVYTLDVYAGPSCGTREWIGTTDLQTALDDGTLIRVNGTGSYVPVLSLGYVADNGAPEYASATVTGPEGTSELSDCTAISGAPPPSAADFVVDSTGDGGDETVGNGICLTVAGQCTLRAAIEEINASAAGGTISFAIPGSGSQQIALGAALPALTKPVVIDGTTQAAFEGPNAPPAGTLAIELNGDGAGDSDGLTLAAGSGGSEIRGLDVRDFTRAGIRVESDGNTVAGNYLGTTVDGVTDAGNGRGIDVLGQSNHIGGTTAADRNLISANLGEAVLLDGTVTSLSGTEVSGNWIGVDATGTAALPNGDGISALNASGVVIGGSTLSAGNLIGSSNGFGIQVNGPFPPGPTANVIRFNTIGLAADGISTLTGTGGTGAWGLGIDSSDGALIADNVVANTQGSETGITVANSSDVTLARNFVGTDRGGTLDHGNGGEGIRFDGSPDSPETNGTIGGSAADANVVRFNSLDGIALYGTTSSGVSYNQIRDNGGDGVLIESPGGDTVGPANTISQNGGAGIAVLDTQNEGSFGNRFTQNEIDGNGGLGIDLGSDGITPNDVNDGDPGINGLLNFPVVSTATLNGASLEVDGTLDVTGSIDPPLPAYTVELFASPTCDPSGNGEGASYLGSVTVSPDGGSFPWSTTVPAAGVGVGDVITATTTDASEDSSELSACATVTGGGQIDGSIALAPANPIDLSAEGTLDWAVWGYGAGGASTSLAPDVSKAGGAGISDLTDIDAGTDAPLRGLGQFADSNNPMRFSWSDGAPAPASASSVPAGLQHNGEGAPAGTVGDGFSLTVPADTSARVLRLYVQMHRAAGRMTATLSDGSAAADVDAEDVGGNDGQARVYTVTYHAASAGQTLTLEWVETADNCGGNYCDNVSIHAATLSEVTSTFTVTSAGDAGDGTCDATCTLRDAVLASNADPDPSAIVFAITGGAPYTIPVSSGTPLPDLAYPVRIDGTTQSEYAGDPVVELRGQDPAGAGVGLHVAAGAADSELSGLAFTCFGTAVRLDSRATVRSSVFGLSGSTGPDPGSLTGVCGSIGPNGNGDAIDVLGDTGSVVGPANTFVGNVVGVYVSGGSTSSTTIEGNRFGLGPSDVAAANTGGDVWLRFDGGNNVVGGPAPEDANVFVGAPYALLVEGSPSAIVEGNDIGVTALDTWGVPYSTTGPFAVKFSGSDDATFRSNRVFGPDGSSSTFDEGGVVVESSDDVQIEDNVIGTSDGFAADAGFYNYALRLVDANDTTVTGNQFGFTRKLDGGVVAGPHVVVESGTGNRVIANGFRNGQPIDLGADGETANDPGDGDTGPNNLQNTPVIQTVVPEAGGDLTVTWALDTAPGLYTIDFYVRTPLGTIFEIGDAAEVPQGSGSITFTPTTPVAPDDEIGAIATGLDGTSEFSPFLGLAAGAVDTVAISPSKSSVVAGAGRVPLADVPPSAFLTNPAGGNQSAPVNDVPINDVLLRDSPVNDIPINDVGLPALASQLGDVLLSTVPLLRPGGWEQALTGTALAGRPLQTITLQDVFTLSPPFVATLELSDLDLSKSPLGRISAVAYALGTVTLADMTFAGGACTALAGPPINCGAPGDIAGRTLLSLGIQGAPINDVPVNEIPVNDVPVNEIPVNDVPINEITVDGTPVNDVPINDVPVNDVPVNDVPINDIPVNEIPVNDVATRSLPINEIPVNDIPVNEIPVNDIPVNEVPVNEIPVNDIPVNEVPVNEILVNDVLLAGSPVNDIPVNDIASPGDIFDPVPAGGTVGSNAGSLAPGVTLGDLRRAMQGGGAPDDLPDSVTLGSLTGGYGQTTTGDLIEALAAITYGAGQNPPTLAQIVGLIKNYAGSDPPKPTFGDLFDLLLAIDADSATVNLTLTDIAHLLYGSDATLADLLATVLSSRDLGWEKLDLDGLGVSRFADDPDSVSFDVVTTFSGSASTVVVRATLPDGFTYVPASSQAGAPLQPIADPDVNGQELTWTVAAAAPPTLALRFSARAGTRLGSAATTAAARIGAQALVPAAAPAVVEVTETFPGAALPTPQAIDGNAFYLSYISSSQDGDAYSLPAPPAGSRVTINLSHLPADYDLVVYGPGGQVLVPEAPGTVPLDGQPVADQGTAPTHTIDSVPAQILGDVPVAAGRTVVGISANRTNQDDAVVFVSDGVGPYVAQVNGFNGETSNEPYMLRAEVLPPRAPAGCEPRSFPSTGTAAGSLTGPVPDGVDTVFVVNKQQLERIYGTAAANDVLAALGNGLGSGFPSSVLQVDAIPAVRSAYDAWNDCPSSAAAANDVVRAVGDAVRAFRADHATVEYVVLVGSDDVVPFGRLDDRTTLSNEGSYAGTFPGDTSLGGSLATEKILSDDPYGTLHPIPFLDRQLYVPELSVGRLVETPAQIVAQLGRFGSGELDLPTALTTGYDFLSDGAQEVGAALGDFATVDDSLVSGTWTAAQLEAKLATPPAIVSINAHADHTRFQAADGSLTGSDALAGALTFSGRIVFSMGCHAGLNVPDAFLPPSARRDDWTQAFVGRGAAVVVANTGYGYGDSDVVAYSEDLNRRFAENLADGLDAGAALTLAKQEFKSELALVGVYDEKSMAELTLYGLPQYRVAGLQAQAAGGLQPLATGPAEADAVTPQAVTLATLSTDPVTGLQVEPFDITDAGLTSRRVTRPRGDFYRGRNGVIVTHLRPLQPKAVEPLSAANAHGALVTGLTSQDVSPFDPLFARPLVDSTATEPELAFDDVAFPARLQTVTTYETPSGRKHRLVLAQGQFFAAAPDDGLQTGFQRLFTHIEGHVFTSASSDYEPPLFRSVQAVKVGGLVTFTTELGAADAVERVLVLYLDGPGAWTPLDLVPVGGGRWSGTAAVSAARVQYFVQAVDEHGNVAVSTNKGFYYAGEAAPPPTPGGVEPTLSGPETNGTFTGTVQVGAIAAAGVTASVSVDGAAFTEDLPVSVSSDGVHTVVVEGSDGSRAETAFVIDTSGPVVTVTESPGGASDATATIAFTLSEPGTAACTFDGNPYTPCSSPVELTGLGSGGHTFTIRGTDAFGNQGPLTSLSWTVDLVAPTITITSPVSGAAYRRGSTVTAAFTCTDAGSGVSSCVGTVPSGSPIETATTGTKTFVVNASDGAGNETTRSVTYSVFEACVGAPPAGAIVRGGGNDTINGTAGDDVIYDSGGNNKIDGKGGNDLICSGPGNDVLLGGDGNDVLIDSGGNNTVDSGNGNDEISTRNGNDKLKSGAGDDTVTDTGGNNAVDAGLGDDQVTTGAGNDAISTGDGNDVVTDAGGNNAIATGRGDDRVTAGSSNDAIAVGEGNDIVIDAGGNNAVDVGAGTDQVTTGAGNDTIAGGAHDDTIDAGNGNNVVSAGSGSDRVTTGSGNDRIDGGPGYDTCSPGAGRNSVTHCEA